MSNIQKVSEVPAVVNAFDFGGDEGMGFENQTQEDMSIPYINIIQSLSPQLRIPKTPYALGMLYNTITKEGTDGTEGLHILPIYTEHKFVEYTPRKVGGGFVAAHEPSSHVVAKAKAASTKFGKYTTENKNDLIETFYVYAMDLDNEGFMVIPFFSTKIQQYRAFMTTINLFNPRAWGIKGRPPLFSHRVHLTTEEERWPGGESYNFRLNPLYPETRVDGVTYPAILNSLVGPGNPQYQKAKEFLELVQGGRTAIAHEREYTEEDDTSSDQTTATGTCPF